MAEFFEDKGNYWNKVLTLQVYCYKSKGFVFSYIDQAAWVERGKSLPTNIITVKIVSYQIARVTKIR